MGIGILILAFAAVCLLTAVVCGIGALINKEYRFLLLIVGGLALMVLLLMGAGFVFVVSRMN